MINSRNNRVTLARRRASCAQEAAAKVKNSTSALPSLPDVAEAQTQLDEDELEPRHANDADAEVRMVVVGSGHGTQAAVAAAVQQPC
eukprot:1845937-Prymnesium_polylepis.2